MISYDLNLSLSDFFSLSITPSKSVHGEQLVLNKPGPGEPMWSRECVYFSRKPLSGNCFAHHVTASRGSPSVTHANVCTLTSAHLPLHTCSSLSPFSELGSFQTRPAYHCCWEGESNYNLFFSLAHDRKVVIGLGRRGAKWRLRRWELDICGRPTETVVRKNEGTACGWAEKALLMRGCSYVPTATETTASAPKTSPGALLYEDPSEDKAVKIQKHLLAEKFFSKHMVPGKWGFPCGSVVNNAGDAGSIPGSGRSPGGEDGNPLKYSFQKNLMDAGDWQAAVLGLAKSLTRLKQLSTKKMQQEKELGVH